MKRKRGGNHFEKRRHKKKIHSSEKKDTGSVEGEKDVEEDKMAFWVYYIRAYVCESAWEIVGGGRGRMEGIGTTGSLGDKTDRTEIGFNTRGVTIVTAEAVFPSRSLHVYIHRRGVYAATIYTPRRKRPAPTTFGLMQSEKRVVS